jgi:hypothetical protein
MAEPQRYKKKTVAKAPQYYAKPGRKQAALAWRPKKSPQNSVAKSAAQIVTASLPIAVKQVLGARKHIRSDIKRSLGTAAGIVQSKQFAPVSSLPWQGMPTANRALLSGPHPLVKKRHTKMAKLPSAPYYAQPGRKKAALAWRPGTSTASKSKITRRR